MLNNKPVEGKNKYQTVTVDKISEICADTDQKGNRH